MNYEYLNSEMKNEILDNQLRDLEASHFSLLIAQPSQLSDPQGYQQWYQQKMLVESTLMRVRQLRDSGELFVNNYEEE
tara:strand:- start:247 stop:480 length:234 start_codon:yes stop_codon:yes gene_type:complete